MVYPKRLIIVRHGETTLDKNDPNRTLTLVGKTQSKNAGVKLKCLVDPHSSIILSNKTVRCKQTAQILSEILNAPVEITSNVRFKKTEGGSDTKFLQNNHLGLAPGAYYLRLHRENKLPSGIKTPEQIVKDLLKDLHRYRHYHTVVLVGHEGSLDAFLRYQKVYQRVKRGQSGTLKYGESVIFSDPPE